MQTQEEIVIKHTLVDRLVFHVSPTYNDASILKAGVDPFYSRGASLVSWWVDDSRLMWAVAHCSARKGVPTSDLTIWAANRSQLRKVRNSRWSGVFSTPCMIRPVQKFKISELLRSPND